VPRIKMVYFAQAREAAGTNREVLALPGTPRVSAALSKAFTIHPRLGALENVIRVAVNEEIISDDALLRDGDRVAILPPIVGG
jgi:molybdopterin synthase sulfur carrier subunit